MAALQIRRVYDPLEPMDGQRVLVDRIWPRGLPREKLAGAIWLKDVAPSTELRKFFAHRPEHWNEFRKRYWAELDSAPEAVAKLRALMKKGRVTLLYSARDREHNQAVALADYLRRR